MTKLRKHSIVSALKITCRANLLNWPTVVRIRIFLEFKGVKDSSTNILEKFLKKLTKQDKDHFRVCFFILHFNFAQKTMKLPENRQDNKTKTFLILHFSNWIFVEKNLGKKFEISNGNRNFVF